MVIKLHETHSAQSVAILFLLYNLFNRLTLVKPYTTNFISARKYLVCKGLKQRRPRDAILHLYSMLELGDGAKLVKCNHFMHELENENKFMMWMKNHNQSLISIRTQLCQAAIGRCISRKIDCYNFKFEIFRKWGLPVTQVKPDEEELKSHGTGRGPGNRDGYGPNGRGPDGRGPDGRGPDGRGRGHKEAFSSSYRHLNKEDAQRMQNSILGGLL